MNALTSPICKIYNYQVHSFGLDIQFYNPHMFHFQCDNFDNFHLYSKRLPYRNQLLDILKTYNNYLLNDWHICLLHITIVCNTQIPLWCLHYFSTEPIRNVLVTVNLSEVPVLSWNYPLINLQRICLFKQLSTFNCSEEFFL